MSTLHNNNDNAQPLGERRAAEPVADAPFLRRILVGLITATVLTGAMTAALTSRPPLPEQPMEVAVGP